MFGFLSNRLKQGAFLCAGLFLLGACADSMDYSSSPQFNREKGRFEHPNGVQHDKSFFDMLGLATQYFSRSQDPAEITGFPLNETGSAALEDFSENLIWIGQSSLLVNHNGVTLLTDPHFTERASPFSFMGPKRVTPIPFEIAELPAVDIVLISHNHYDHLDKQSVIQLAQSQPDIQFLVPLGLKEQLQKWGVKNVTELDWWQATNLLGTVIQPTPVQHWSKRSAFDRNKSLWAGWMVQWDDFSFYFAGDTGYSEDFKQTAKRLGSPTLAALPIGAYAPREFMAAAHANPEEAVKMFTDLGASYGVAIHWGTFKLTIEPMAEPAQKLKDALDQQGIAKDRFVALQHGEAWDKPFTDR